MESYSNHRSSSSPSSSKGARVSSDSHSSRGSYTSAPSHRQAERTGMEAYADYRVSSSHESAGRPDPVDRSSGALHAAGLDHSDAYADYARSRLQAGLPVGGNQSTSHTPSYRQAETKSLNALDTHRRAEPARTTRDQEIATHRQAEIESMQALAEYRDEQEVIARREVRSQYPDRATPGENYADRMAAHQKATRIEARADQVHELGKAALVLGGAIGLKINQQGLNQAANILSRSAPLYRQTVQQLTFSAGTARQKIGAAMLAANVTGSKAVGNSMGFLGFTNPNYASTAVVKDASRWTLSGKAQSTQALSAAERLRGPVSKLTMGAYGGALGLEVGLRAYAEGVRGTTREEVITNTVIGGLKATDNAIANGVGTVVGGLIGSGVGFALTLPSGGTGAAYGAYVGSAGGAILTDAGYRGYSADRAYDNFVESKRGFVNDYATPSVIAVDDWIDRNRHSLGAMFGAPGVPHGDVSIPRRPMREISIPMPWDTNVESR